MDTSDVPIVFRDPDTGVDIELSLEESADARARYPEVDRAARKYRLMFGPGRLIVYDDAIIYQITESGTVFTVARW